MSHDELEKIYAQLDAVIGHLEADAEDLLAQAKVLREVREKLASGGGPADR
jgi:hypothetical protein